MRRNWAGNVEFRAGAFRRPRTVAELQRLVAGSARVRAVGTAHSFSRIADTTGDLISVAGLPPGIEIDPDGPAATVSAGLRYSDIAPRLHAAGFALANLASLPHLSVAGAVATGTHGSGTTRQCLAAAVSAVELVSGTGDLIAVRRDVDPDRLAGLAVSLGACGIVTAVTLDLVPAFGIRQWVCERVPFEAIAGNFAAITGAAYSVSVFTGWGEDRLDRVWLKCAALDPDPPAGWFGGRLAEADRQPIAGLPADSATPQGGEPGPWHERLPHFRPEFTPSAGAELQSEFLLDRADAPAALLALDRIRVRLAPVVQVSEIRTVAADELWLSPAYRRASVAIHFTWIPDPAAVAPVLAIVEAALAPFAPRPHWGKISSIPAAEVARRYPRMADFRRLAAEFDPGSKFRNEYLDRYLSEPGGA
jgi:xylitol oxidase